MFQVGSDLIVVTNNKVGFNTAQPKALVHINGDLRVDGTCYECI